MKLKNHSKETPETFCTCDLPKNFFKTSAKENLCNYQRKSKHWGEPAIFNYEVINVQSLVQSDWESYCCCQNLLADMNETTATCV